jgi:uncharacterized protein
VGDEVDYRPANYGQPLPFDGLHTGQNVLFADFCAPEDDMRFLAEDVGCNITVYDHHKTAKAAMSGLLADKVVDGVFDMERSGCGITWDEIHGADRPRLFNYMEDRDLWRWALPETMEIFAYVASFPYDFHEWRTIMDEMESDDRYRDMFNQGSAILRKQAKDISEWLEQGT